jgi:glutamate racemase
MDKKLTPIGIFDSGYGGLTVFKEIEALMPGYDYIYLGDNARAPYGSRSFESVYQYTLSSVQWLFDQGCPLVILACNTASAKALRSIQQNDLAKIDPTKRVLGVIRPTAEYIGAHSKSKAVGVLATKGTVLSNSYPIEIQHLDASLQVYQQACPTWVPLIENNEYETPGAAFFIERDVKSLLAQNKEIDTLLLGCTHYPIIEKQIRSYLPENIQLISQGAIVAHSLEAYLQRHNAMEMAISKQGTQQFYTTDDVNDFNMHAPLFYGKAIASKHVHL